MKVNNPLLLLTILLSVSFLKVDATIKNSDSLLVERYIKHIYSLEYIIRKTDNSSYFTTMSDDYCDSIMTIDADNKVATEYLKRNDLIRSTCDQNLNYRVRFFAYLSGIPDWMGFADDPIEYAYDDAIGQLLDSKYFQLYNGPLGNANLTSVIINNNCDDEMFEIGVQTFIKNSSHYILPKYLIEGVLGHEETERLLSGHLHEDDLSALCSKLNIDQLGIYSMSDLDVINEEIWLVKSTFQLFDIQNGLNDSVAYKGFSMDKRSVSILDIVLNVLLSLLILTLLSFASIAVFRFQTLRFISTRELFKLFLEQFNYVLRCFPIPITVTVLVITALTAIVPEAPEHYLEFTSKLWAVLLTIGISLIPILLNLFFINRLNMDGFHTIRGYRIFSITSIYSGSFIFSLFAYLQVGAFDYLAQLIILLNAIIIGDLLARSYFQFSAVNSNTKSSRPGVSGLILSALFLVLSSGFLITSYTISSAFVGVFLLACCSGLLYVYKKIKPLIVKTGVSSNGATETSTEIPFVDSLVNPKVAIFDAIQRLASDTELNVMLISGRAGIGKTRSILRAKSDFINSGWDWYYGDCDEVQNDMSPSFEPFLEAFKDLLAIDEFSDRGQHLESVVGSALEVGATLLPSDPSAFIKPYNRTSAERMTETCIEIIDKLEKKGKNLVFVMEDVQWIDSESYVLLKLFIQVINRNKFARSKVTILLTIRDDDFITYRGPNSIELKTDLQKLQTQTSNKFLIHDILTSKDYKLLDFMLFLNNKDSKIRLQSATLIQLNELFNKSVDQIMVTPRYILNTIENWILDGTLEPSNDGFKLVKQISISDLPSEIGADVYYHEIISNYEDKWGRLLESAAIIGHKFDATILAKVWNYELLDVLSFLELAVKDKLVVDLSKEDNIFVFGEKDKNGTGKRVIHAIKTFYQSSHLDNSEKQITVEYNKRYIHLHEEVVNDLSKQNTEDLLIYLKRLCPLLSNDHYLKHARVVIFEVVTRLVYQELSEKLSSVVSILNNYKELAGAIKVIESISVKSLSEPRTISFATADLSKYQEFTLVYDLILLVKLIQRGKEKVAEKHLKYIEENLIKNHSANVGIYLTTLLADAKYHGSDFSKKIELISDYNEKLKPNIIGDHIHLYSVMDLRYQNSQITPGDTGKLDSDSLELYKNIKDEPLLEFLKVKVFNLRLRILANILENENQAISEFRAALIEDFQKKDYNWISIVLTFLTSYSAGVYIKKYSDEAKLLLEDCEIITYKYTDEKVWNILVNQLLTAKSSFELSQGNLKIALHFSQKNSELMINNKRKGDASYRETCTHIARIYEAMGEGQKSIEKRLESIELLKVEMTGIHAADDKYRKELSVDYNNISHVYRNHLKEYDEALKFAKLSLEFKNPDEGKGYGISLYMVGRAYDSLEQYENALSFYNEGKQYITGHLTRDVYQKNVFDLNIGLAMIQSEHSNSQIVLNKAVKSLQTKEMEVYLTGAIKERLNFAKTFLS